MQLKVVGAGVGRTATASLKRALEYLLGGSCYHMRELIANPDHAPVWHSAAFGTMPDWHAVLPGYVAAVDYPASAFWPELSAAFPEALVLLSLRSGESWWESARQTIYAPREREPGLMTEMSAQISRTRFPIHPIIHKDRQASIDLFNGWNQRVIDMVPPERLLVWQASDGWEPICAALGLPLPPMPFPHTNTKEEWWQRVDGEEES